MGDQLVDEEDVQADLGSRKTLTVDVPPRQAAVGALIDTADVLPEKDDVGVCVMEGGREDASSSAGPEAGDVRQGIAVEGSSTREENEKT